ncbi:MAG: hypothetical protein HY594_03555 [Candidatus Omnitrophica bacterium]|nr:hypothetical protein [Candidatus Omnitrophota bacterium]
MKKIGTAVAFVALFLASGAMAEEVQWTQTTVGAAKTPEEQAILQKGKVATVTGEVVDVSCYLQLGKKGQGHIACGAGCIRNGMPIGLLTEKNELYFVFPEEHDPRRGGTVSIREFFADRVGQPATVTGLLVEQNGHRALFVPGAPLTPAA